MFHGNYLLTVNVKLLVECSQLFIFHWMRYSYIVICDACLQMVIMHVTLLSLLRFSDSTS